MNGEKNCVKYVEVSGRPYYKNDSGALELVPDDKVELSAKPPLIHTDITRLRNCTYSNLYPVHRFDCSECGRLFARQVKDKNKMYYVCACGQVTHHVTLSN